MIQTACFDLKKLNPMPVAMKKRTSIPNYSIYERYSKGRSGQRKSFIGEIARLKRVDQNTVKPAFLRNS